MSEFGVLSGFSAAAFPSTEHVPLMAEAFLVSPPVNLTVPSCMIFHYFLRSNLIVSVTNGTGTYVIAVMKVDGGYDYHQAFIDLPYGSYHVIWQLHLDSAEPLEIVKNYRAAVDNIHFTPTTCAHESRYPLYIM